MANHGYVSSKKFLTKAQVLQDLQEINERRFNGLLKIEPSEYGSKGSWFISYQEKKWKYPVGFNIWISSKKKLEHRHTHGWGFYLEIVFSSELGKKYGGKISDDCCPEKWDPDPKKYPTYKSWVESSLKHIKKHKIMYKSLYTLEMTTCPKALRDM